jgi:hypothetical protein
LEIVSGQKRTGREAEIRGDPVLLSPFFAIPEVQTLYKKTAFLRMTAVCHIIDSYVDFL